VLECAGSDNEQGRGARKAVAKTECLECLRRAVADKGGAAAWSLFKTKQAKVDLTKADLSNLDLRTFDLAQVDLAGANLFNADLSGSDLSEASLTYADLRRANLAHAFLTKANLAVANLQGANMVDANLDFANLRSAKLDGAYLMGATLVKANLEGANLRGANLKFANLTGATVTGADVEDANLCHIQLSDKMMRQFRNFDNVGLPEKPVKDYTIDDWMAVTQMAPNNDRAYYNLGIKYFESGLVEMAIQAYRKAIDLNPHNYQALHNLKISLLVQTLSP